MKQVQRWTGREAKVLRSALRMSTRAFAEYLGVAPRTVAKWEKLGASTLPRPEAQAILDTVLARADPAAQERFEAASRDAASLPGPRVDCEAWAEDLDRVIACLARQSFGLAASLLNRWIGSVDRDNLDDRSRYLYARTLVSQGDMLRDQGELQGPLSARQAYTNARRLFAALDIPRRTAQVDLSLAVLDEMSGQLSDAARAYKQLGEDTRLSGRDRARARLWVGTVLSKKDENDCATRVMKSVTDEFERLGEPEEWSVGHQKLALAYRGVGDLDSALQHIATARQSGAVASPLQDVRWSAARGHILLSDHATWNEGLSVLDAAAASAAEYGLTHQLLSIERVRGEGIGRSSAKCKHAKIRSFRVDNVE